jgi:hypothetical protein
VVEHGSFTALFVIHALPADCDALFPEHVGDTGLGDAVLIADLLGGFLSLVPMNDVGDILGGQEAFRARFWAVLARQGWSSR